MDTLVNEFTKQCATLRERSIKYVVEVDVDGGSTIYRAIQGDSTNPDILAATCFSSEGHYQCELWQKMPKQGFKVTL